MKHSRQDLPDKDMGRFEGNEIDFKQISAKELFSAIEELLAEGRQAAFTVTGMSMWPFLCHGRDQVIVASCRPEEIRRGDVALLQTYYGNYLLHRVTKLRKDSFQTTGDGNCFRDGFFPFSCLRARVVRMVRKGKSIDCGSARWRLIFFIWMFLYPFRRQMLWLLRSVSRLKGKIGKTFRSL